MGADACSGVAGPPRSSLLARALALSALSAAGCSATHCDFCALGKTATTKGVWPEGTYSPAPEPGKHVVEVIDTRRIVPGPGLPESIEPMLSNNNLDVVRYDGRTYLAFRTAPSHFASAETRIEVVSSADETTWKAEASYHVGKDLREPRFLPIGGKLFLYVTELGVDDTAFQPGAVKYATLDHGAWSAALTPLFTDQRLLWRTTLHDGVGYVTSYTGGEEIYKPIEIFGANKVQALFDTLLPTPLFAGTVTVTLATTTDGVTFTPVASPMHQGGASETAVAFDAAGNGYAVMRTELPEPPDGNAGSNVCRAAAGDLSHWTCRPDKRKFDSPFMFEHDGEIYLLARRNLGQRGLYAPERVTTVEDYVFLQEKYACARKRCALWRYVQGEDRIAYVTDLPSRGDTCFPSVLPGANPDEVVVYDYSAPLNDPKEQRWCEAQYDVTHIYRHALRFSPNDGTRTQAGAYRPPTTEDARACEE
jgi:hypothetical protein